MATPLYYRIYNVVGGNMSKQRLVLPEQWASPKKRMLGPDHRLPDRGEAIAILEEIIAMQRDHIDIGILPRFGSKIRPLRIKRQLALAELGNGGSGRLIAVTNEKDEVVLL